LGDIKVGLLKAVQPGSGPTLLRLAFSATSLPMPKVRINYDGWLALPAAARHALGVDTGDQLEVEVVDGRIVLRPLKASAADGFADEELPPAAAEPELAAALPPAGKRGPGRPRKAPPAASPPTLKTRGRHKAVPVGELPR
jgi:AbrB family looped-hinge helix DNA binding protein